MARVSGPLFSMSASGSVGKAITFGIWKGRPWCRVWFKPENPQSAKQVNVRTAMSLLVEEWQSETDARKAAYDAYAAPFGVSGFNKYISRGMAQYVTQITVDVTPVSVAVDDVNPPAETWTWT
jgi:hypothetical protein